MGSAVTSGLSGRTNLDPNVETLGYSHLSLRDKKRPGVPAEFPNGFSRQRRRIPLLSTFALRAPKSLKFRFKRRPISTVLCLFGPHFSVKRFPQDFALTGHSDTK